MTEQQKAEAYVREKCGLKVPEALPLPVKYDGMVYYWGANDEMIADTIPDFAGGELLRIRGWGRIQHLKVEGKTPEQLQDELAYWIADAINAYSKPHLQHWLRVLEGKLGTLFVVRNSELAVEVRKGRDILFNLTTGQPDAEADYKSLCDILGI